MSAPVRTSWISDEAKRRRTWLIIDRMALVEIEGHRSLFFADMNTQRKLERHIAEPPWVHQFGRNLLIIDVTGLANHGSNWNIKVFEHLNHTRYLLHEEDIVEVSFPLEKIMGALRSHFVNVRVVDPNRRRPTGKSERLFFIANRPT